MGKRCFVISLSGGQDSTTCLAHILDAYPDAPVKTVSFDYGQMHRRELLAAALISETAGMLFGRSIEHECVVVRDTLSSTSPLVSNMPLGHYESPDTLPQGLEATFVPFRNLLFATIAANRALELAQRTQSTVAAIVLGVSQEDYGGYPDCRDSFIAALANTLVSAIDDKSMPALRVLTPLLYKTKCETVEMSERTPFARKLLAYSSTCYASTEIPCGTCHACLLREKGYTEAGIVDPLFERLNAGPRIVFGQNVLINPREQYASTGTELNVIEIWRTIQGEGPYAGKPAIFIRLAGCNLRCYFCDTEFERGAMRMSVEWIHEHVMALAGERIKLVVLTGGQPLAQQILPLCYAFTHDTRNPLAVQIETAGTVVPPVTDMGLTLGMSRATVVCSPKTPTVHAGIATLCHAWKYIIRAHETSTKDGLPIFSTQQQGQAATLFRPVKYRPEHIWVQPMDEQDDRINALNLRETVRVAIEYGYNISLQQHKLMGVD